MNTRKIIPIIKGGIKHIPGVKRLFPYSTGGTTSSRYCYSVWLRHLHYVTKETNGRIPQVIAELGPGDSLGIGLAALLSGSKKYFALDVLKYWSNKKNLQIFDELVELYKSKTPIPDNFEFPKISPILDDYRFPDELLTKEHLSNMLDEKRLLAIRSEIEEMGKIGKKDFIDSYVPWYDDKIIKHHSIDLIYSQAVLEHVDDIEHTYSAMSKWLKPTGILSHTIDFKSHGVTKAWNGHWTFSEFEWKIVKGGRGFLINRYPFTEQLKLREKYGFIDSISKCDFAESSINRKQLSQRFRHIPDEDLRICSAYVLSKNFNNQY